MIPSAGEPSLSVDERDVTRSVVWNQALWTAGWSLTTGGFLAYFAGELGTSGLAIALVLAMPETVGIVGLWARPIVHRFGGRKRVWICYSIAARIISLGIPFLAFEAFHPARIDARWMLVLFVALTHAAQAVAYMAFLSWLADLVPEYHWGRFFAKQNVSKLCVMLVVPVAGGYMKDAWRGASPQTALWGYVTAFIVGNLLMLCSLMPLLRYPNIPIRSFTVRLPDWKVFSAAFKDRSFRFLLIHSWWLAFANGLTQVAFFQYRYKALGISLALYYILENTTTLVKIPLSPAAGFLSDRFGNKALLFWGTLAASAALPFWLIATRETWWWLFGAYVLWGAFAFVNISGRKLMLTLAPRGDNAAHIALFYQVAGLLAGISGVLGGLWWESLDQAQYSLSINIEKFGFPGVTYVLGSFQILFLASFVGRATSALWILPIQEPGTKGVRWMLRSWRGLRRCRRRMAFRREEGN